MSLNFSNQTKYNFLKRKHRRYEEEFQEINQLDFFSRQEKEFFNDPFCDILRMYGPNNLIEEEDEISFEDLYLINDKKMKINIFKVIKSEICLFTKAKQDLLESILTGVYSTSPSRSPKRLPNFKQKHYIRVIIKRNFFNRHLLNALNKKLKDAGFNICFMKFPQDFVVNVAKEINKKLINMTLKEIFKAKKFYKKEENTNYYHNLKIIDKIEKEGDAELNIILNRKVRFLFEEYLCSEELGIDEIERLKKAKNTKDEYYIEKYIYLAQNFIEFCCQNIELDYIDFYDFENSNLKIKI